MSLTRDSARVAARELGPGRLCGPGPPGRLRERDSDSLPGRPRQGLLCRPCASDQPLNFKFSGAAAAPAVPGAGHGAAGPDSD